ncbi:MAG: hypothetical protein ACI33P_09955 [Lysinibacillus sp.]
MLNGDVQHAILGAVGAIYITVTFAYFAMLYKRRYSKSMEA